MPFDNTNLPEEVRILDEMAKLLARPENWMKGQTERTWSTDDVSRCLYGALLYVDHGDSYSFTGADAVQSNFCKYASQSAFNTETLLFSLAFQLYKGDGHFSLWRFNDCPETSHNDILALIAAARKKIMETA